MLMAFAEVKVDKLKELQVFKLNEKYRGLVVDGDLLLITEEEFDSPLKAANGTRKLKKYKGLEKQTPAKENTNVKKTKICKEKRLKLYTEQEMSCLTHLRFREAWVVLNKLGQYVESALSNTEVVKYTKNKDKAKSFKTYEEAILLSRTLDSVCSVGHTLKRFFVENK